MYNCEKVLGLINEYIDKELPEDELKEIELHLEQCSECKAEYDLSIKLKNEMASLNQISLPDEFNESLHKKLTNANKKSSNSIIKILTSIAAVVLLFIFSAHYLNINSLKDSSFKATGNRRIAMVPTQDEKSVEERTSKMQTFGATESVNGKEKGVTNAKDSNQYSLKSLRDEQQSRSSGLVQESGNTLNDRTENTQIAAPEHGFDSVKSALSGESSADGLNEKVITLGSDRYAIFNIAFIVLLIVAVILYTFNKFKKRK